MAKTITFVPDSVEIVAGDTILWVNDTGDHTTTSGTGSADPQAGVLWNEILDNFTQPTYQRPFPSTGIFPYFCIPHEDVGMKGVIVVVAGEICACPCAYDPRCDGIISDVLDVSDTINRAFRGAAPTKDPNCPYERTDVDGSGASDVLDVTKVINVAFRGNSAGSQYDLNLCLAGDQ